MQQGDVKYTHANIDLLFNWIKFKPSTNLESGVKGLYNGLMIIINLKNEVQYFNYWHGLHWFTLAIEFSKYFKVTGFDIDKKEFKN